MGVCRATVTAMNRRRLQARGLVTSERCRSIVPPEAARKIADRSRIQHAADLAASAGARRAGAGPVSRIHSLARLPHLPGRHPESEGCIPTPPMIPASVIWPHQAYRRVLPTGCRTSIRMDAPVGRCTTDAGGGASRYRLRATPSRTARRLHSKVMNSTTLNRKCRTGVCHLEEKQQQGEYFLAMVIQNVIVTQRRLPICRTHPFPSPHASL